jgi:uncharacterized protein (TIGR03435 family)
MKRVPLVASLAIATALASSLALHGQSQSTGGTPPFEVASVKPSNPNPGSPLGAIPMVMPPVNGRFSATNVPLRLLIRIAYAVQDFQIVGGPSWQMSNKFDITAKAAEGTATAMPAVLSMVKTLLADRFKLKVHTETRELPISALVIARSDKKLGPDMKPSTADCSHAQAEAQKRADVLAKGGPTALAAVLPKPGESIPCSMQPLMNPAAGGFGLRGNGQPMMALVQLLTQATGRIVQDKTGLTGLYDWELRFDPEILMRMASQAGVNLPGGASLPPSDSPSLLTALQEQLGLKLDSERGPVEVLVIDSAELPEPD